MPSGRLPFCSPEVEADICRQYGRGVSSTILMRKHGVSRGAILRAVRRRDGHVPGKGKRRRCKLDEAAFSRERRGDPVCRYHIGLLLADGCVSDAKGRQKTINLSLKADDAASIRFFRRFVGSTHKIRYCLQHNKKTGQWHKKAVIQIRSDRMAADLLECGIGPRKSLTAHFNDNLHLDRDVIRGLVDGDGSLQKDHKGFPNVHMIGSRKLIEQFLEYVNTIWPTQAQPRQVGNIWITQICGQGAYKLIADLYRDGDFAMRRKARMAKKILRECKKYGDLPLSKTHGIDGEKLLELHRLHGSWAKVSASLGMSPMAGLWKLRKSLGILEPREEKYAWVTKPMLEELRKRFPSWEQVAKHLGISQSWLRCLCIRHGLPTAKEIDYSEYTKERLLELRAQCKSWCEVARRIGIGPNNIGRFCKVRGIV